MPTTVGQHAVATFTSPVNGTTPIDANTVRGNDNTLRTAYVSHDADPGVHVQSSTLASRPVAGTAGRKWITVDAGSYKLWYDDGTRWHEVGGDAIELEVIADVTLAKGDVISVTGYNNGQNVPTVNKYTGAAPAFGIANEAIAAGARGYVVNTGTITDIATNTFGATGTILYPAATGTFTSTKPTSGTYQVVAYVLRSNASNGVLYVEFSAPRIVETSANTADTVVLRDGSGNFSAGTITAALTGNADTATKLSTSRTFAVTGDITGSASSDLTSGVSISTAIAAGVIVNADINAAAAIADTKLATISTAGKVSNSATTATSANTASAIVARDASGNFTAGTITATLTGNADTATKLSSARTFALTGDVTGTVSSDLTSGASISTAIAAGVIVNADISASAEIAVSKLADGDARQVLQTDAAGTGVEWTSNLDVPSTISEAGQPVVVQTDIGSAANEIPLNQTLGTMAFQDAVAVSVDYLKIANDAAATAIEVVATSDTPTDNDPTTDAPAGFIKILVGGAARYLPFYA